MANNEFDGLDRLIEDGLEPLPPDDVVDRVPPENSLRPHNRRPCAEHDNAQLLRARLYSAPDRRCAPADGLSPSARRKRLVQGLLCYLRRALRFRRGAVHYRRHRLPQHINGLRRGGYRRRSQRRPCFRAYHLSAKGHTRSAKRARLEPHAGGAAALIVWYAVGCVLAAMNAEGFILVTGLIISFIFILRSLARLARELDEASYAVHPSPVRVSDRALCITIFC